MVFNGICVERHDCRNELIYHGNNVYILDRINVKKKYIFWEMLTEEMLTEEMLTGHQIKHLRGIRIKDFSW